MKPIADAVLLDARQDVASARAKIIRSGLEWVAVRRTEGLVVFWYAFDTQYVLEHLQHHNDTVSVKDALGLHEYAAAPVGNIGAIISAPVGTNTVILDGSQFIGVKPAHTPSDPDLSAFPNSETILTERPKDLLATPPASTASQKPSSPGPRRTARRRRSFGAARSAGGDPDALSVHASAEAEPSAGTIPVGASPAERTSAAFTAFPRLDAPATVAPREQFTITIGLAPQLQAGTAGGPLTIDLPATAARFTLDILIVTDVFNMPTGGRYRLDVDRADPYVNSITVPLVAPDSVDDPLLTTVSVIYFFEQVPCGTTARRISVIPAGTQPFSDTHGTGTLWTSGDEPSGVVTVRPGVPEVDLTVMISKPDGNPASGQFVWTFQSPHGVELPAEPVSRNLGMDARELGTHIIEGIQNSEAQDMVALEIGGLGRDIADRMPTEFWQLLRAVAKVVKTATPGRPPTVLFLTAEAHVPWELALVDPPLDAGTPPYLGCQTDMGRWPLSDSGTPPLPPAASIDVHRLAIVVGDYAARSGWRKLEKAAQEGNTLASRYTAITLAAEPPQIKQLLYASLPAAGGAATGAEVVHFACHGEATQGHVLDAAIILGQGQRMSPAWLANAPLGKQHKPFLFLNACQVGKSGELLGSFSGFAGESLKGGFRGFLAPLWSVDDGLAHDIAIEFYERVFGSEARRPEPVASVLRDLRRRFAPDTEKSSATRLAYVFYGHPGLILRKED